MTRRGIAAGAGLLVLILLVFAVRGCLGARKDQSFKDYAQDASTISQESQQQGKAFFQLLSAPGGRNRAVDTENRLNQFRVQSAQLVDRAKGVDHPDELSTAQRYLVETLRFRRDGLAQVADALPGALSDQNRRQATDRVTAQMQTFLTSDVLYAQRFAPSLKTAIDDRGLGAEVTIQRSQFLPTVQWLDPAFVADRVGGLRTGRGERATPGLHGTGLGTVSLGGQALTPGGPATVKVTGDLSFQVQVVNQGDSEETDVPVRIAVGRGGETLDLEGRVDSIRPGETKTVNVPVSKPPTTGQTVPVVVSVQPVPGEKKTDNNRQTFSAIFTR
jgi:3-phenylpropionate/cinnamic acid dioxygenase small subunit